MNYFELYPGDYLKDTSRLSMIDHGAYLKLMIAYYGEEQPLPEKYADLYQISGAISASDKEAIRKVADRYFPVAEDGLRHNKRADEEIAKALKRIETARKNGSKGGRKPNLAGNPAGSTGDNPEETQRDTQRPTQSGEALHTPHATLELTPPDGGVVPVKPATPSCPHAEIVGLYHEILPELARVRDWTGDRQTILRARWREKPERQHLEWWRGYFDYVRSCPFLMGQGSSPGRDPFYADLEWLIRPKNFHKVIEGKYQQRRAAA